MRKKNKNRTKIVSINDLARYVGIHRNTMARKAEGINLKDIYQVFDFIRSIDKPPIKSNNP